MAPTTIPPRYIRVPAVVWECGEGQTDTHRRPWPLYISRRLRLTRNVNIIYDADGPHDMYGLLCNFVGGSAVLRSRQTSASRGRRQKDWMKDAVEIGSERATDVTEFANLTVGFCFNKLRRFNSFLGCWTGPVFWTYSCLARVASVG